MNTKNISPKRVTRTFAGILLILTLMVAYSSWQNTKSETAPWIEISAAPKCSVQLVIEAYKQRYFFEEPICLGATLRVRGPCIWQTVRTSYDYDFMPIVEYVDPSGQRVHLADEGSYLLNAGDFPGRSQRYLELSVDATEPYHLPSMCLDQWQPISYQAPKYDFSGPGEYSIQIVHVNHKTGEQIPSNIVTLTREPSLQARDQPTAALWTPISTMPPCAIRLIVEPGREVVTANETIFMHAQLQLRGFCKRSIMSTNPFRNFVPVIERVNPDGSQVQLANEETYFYNTRFWPSPQKLCISDLSARHAHREMFSLDRWVTAAHTETHKYDVSQPGLYRVQFIYRSICHENCTKQVHVRSNEVVFERTP